jgi:hypothetical protein
MASSAFLSITEVPAFSQPRNDRSSEAGVAQSVLYALMGTALGLLTGTAAAVGPWSTNAMGMTHDSVQVSASSAEVSGAAIQNGLQASPVQATQTAAEPGAPVLVRASLETSVAHNSAAAPVHHVAVKTIVKNELRSATLMARMTIAAKAPVVPAAAALAVDSDTVAPEAAPQPATLTIEGDLTMADFDASTGIVETREGRNFSVSQEGVQTGSDGNTLAWQDYAGNVHYRCTQTGSCTLTGSGISAGAKLI